MQHGVQVGIAPMGTDADTSVEPTQHIRTHRGARQSLSAVIVVVIALLGTLFISAPASADANSFAGLVNAERARYGLPAYTLVAELTGVAQAYSEHMASTGVLMHNPNLTTDVRTWQAVGENVGNGADELVIHNALLASPKHLENILNTTFTEIGIGVAVGGGKIWVTQVFRQPVA